MAVELFEPGKQRLRDVIGFPLVDADIAVGANINADKIGTGVVDNTEFDRLNGITSVIEEQGNKGAVSGYAGLDASQELLLTNFPTGTGLQVLRRNTGNTALEFATLTFSDTPWTVDHDADGFDLNDLSNLEFRVTTSAPLGTVPAIYNEATGITLNVPTADSFNIDVNAIAEYTFNATQADFLTNNIVNLGTINTHTVPGGTSTFTLQSDNLSVFAATTSAQLAGVISDETGSGLLVFGTTPTIVTPTIASFVNATHDHSNAAGGGQLDSTLALSDTANIAYLNTANIFGNFDQTFKDNHLRIANPADTFFVNFQTSAEIASRTLTIPLLGANRIIVVTGLASQIVIGTEVTGASTALTDTADIAYLNTPNVYIAGNRQDFLGLLAGTAGINVGAIAGNPTTQVNADIWYNSTTNQLFGRINGANVDLGQSGAEVFVWTANHDANTFALLDARFADDVDATKIIDLNLVGMTTGIVGTLDFNFTTAKTITFPDATATMVGIGIADQLTNTELTSGVFAKITGVGIQTQALDMDGNNIILDAAGNISLDNSAANVTTLKHPTNYPNFSLLRDQIVADGSTAGKVRFRSKDDAAAVRTFGEIKTIIEDTTVAGSLVHGSLRFYVMDANVETNYMNFNAAKSGQIDILKPTLFADVDVIIKDNRLLIESPDGLTPVTFINSQQTLARNLTIPILTGNRNILVSAEGNIVNADLSSGVFSNITGLGTQTQDLIQGAFVHQFTEIVTPANPPANQGKLYSKDVSAVTKLMWLDSAGLETDLLAGGGGGTIIDSIPCVLEVPEGTIAFPDIHALATQGSKVSGFVMPDGASVSKINFKCKVPDALNASPVAKIRVTIMTLAAVAGPQAVRLTVLTKATADTENVDTAFTAEIETTVTMPIATETLDIYEQTLTNQPANGDFITGQLKRDPVDAADTFTGDIMIVAIELIVTRNT